MHLQARNSTGRNGFVLGITAPALYAGNALGVFQGLPVPAPSYTRERQGLAAARLVSSGTMLADCVVVLTSWVS